MRKSSNMAYRIAYIPSIIWLVISSFICLFNFNSFIYYLTILIPPLFIWLTLYLAHRIKFLGGIIFTITGLIADIIILSYFSFYQALPMLLLFTLPITVSGLLFIISSINSGSNLLKIRYSIFKNSPL